MDLKLYRMIVIMTCTLFIRCTVSVSAQKDDGAALTVVESEDIKEEIPDGVGIKLASDTGDPNVELFKPTKEWQTVKKNQPIPKGLHVRYNMQTGLVEAKLLDEDEKKEDKAAVNDVVPDITENIDESSRLRLMKKAVEEAMADLQNKEKETEDKFQHWKDGEKEGIVNMKKDSFSKEELKEALKKFKKQDDVQGTDEKQKLRTLDQIKEELKDVDLNMKTDSEIIRDLFIEYLKKDLSVERRVTCLSEFDYYLHQIDNAINFVDIGGLDRVIKDLNHTSAEVRREAALVIGTSSQSNPKVQVHAMKTGVLPTLIRMFSLEATNTLRGRALYAISCILRHFPHAQQEFMKNGGVQALTVVFKQHGTGKLRLKAVTLAVDLLDERIYAEKHANVDNPEQFDKLKQYREVSLLPSLVEGGWCDVVPEMLAIRDHDTREKVLHVMKHLADSCPDFVDDRWRLIGLKTQYSKLSEEETLDGESDGYFRGLLTFIEDILATLEQMHKHMMKDEL